ncbi:HdeD family acid-resistance protein [Muricoccus radiodurans]|uniref:HdeD family acid-resistance protein n=1 Tax=Muricoccus radiodurans TaxID=2231721 RepID=UPI003CF79B35
MSDAVPSPLPTTTAAAAAAPGPALPMPGRFRVMRALARNWWLFLLRGVVSILFGVLVFAMPALGLAFILGMLAAWFALDGAFTLWHAVTGRPVVPVAGPSARLGTGWMWLDGILSLLAAAVLLLAPGLSAISLVLIVAAWMVVSGVFRLLLAFRTGSVLLGLLGALGVLVGAWMAINPGAGLLALIWVVAFQSIAAGVLLIAFSLRLRHVNNDPTPG